jgi:hypothetical protein
LTDWSEGIAQNDDEHEADEVETRQRAYVPPALVEYGSVSKLTQAGNGSFADAGGMMMMMSCL